LGFSVISAISHRFSLVGKIGLSFIVGTGIQTMLMVLLDLCSIPITVTSVFLLSFAVMFVSTYLCCKKKNDFIESLRSLSLKNINYRQFTVLWLIILGILVYFEFLNFEKCIYFPTFDRDSIVGFDFMGKIVANEHTIRRSSYALDLATSLNRGANYVYYTPLVHLSYAYVYLLGAESSKLINALFYLSFIISFYAALRNRLVPTMAISATLFTVLVPEYIAFSSMSATNAIHATYSSLAVIYAWLYFETNERRYFITAILLSMLGIWTRQEGIVFIAAIALILLIKAVGTGRFKDLTVYFTVGISPFIFWLIYLKIFDIGSQSESMNLLPFWDTVKAKTIYSMLLGLLKNTTFYGLTFIASGIALLISLYFIVKSKKSYEMPLMFFTALLTFCLLVYQVEYNWDSLENVMQYSVKRFLFCFVPIAWAFVFVNPVMLKLNDYINKL
jgi:hypothetical protein